MIPRGKAAGMEPGYDVTSVKRVNRLLYASTR